MKEIREGAPGAQLDDLVAALGALAERRGGDGARAVITGVTCDSRAVTPGALFVAVRGLVADGHHFIGAAIEAGAVAVACEELPAAYSDSVTWLVVPDARKALAELSKAFYGNASDKLMLIGVTGTNGKTTTARLVTSMLNASGVAAGYIGTGLCRIGNHDIPLERTTPEPNRLHDLFRQMVDAGCRAAVMEVSSHSLVLDRVHGLFFRAAVFTNLTPEHLDFHETMEEYAEAKRLLFDQLNAEGFAVINADDPRAEFMAARLAPERVFCCSTGDNTSLCDPARRFHAVITASTVEGSKADVTFDGQSMAMQVPLPGAYNVMNMLEAFTVGVGLGIDPATALRSLAAADAIAGRMERIWSRDRSRCAVVDYAHTPDALQKALEALRAVTPADAKLAVVFGCGGNRDRQKRPEMGRIAAELADRVILTSDNPRDENPEAILDEVEAGMAGRVHLRIADRAEAIRRAVEQLGAGDILLVAGKGHEAYQEIRGVKHHFSDRECLEACFAQMK
ncbi:MAG TPA: UDP-N-acetylmuramoyl-L-alanyl-D-glutamate--2,6-diaminopimelate ligase [Chlorobaculum sp.]|uniref:UDP-N-acetylmuramoyl-L-alanyl-D-glutamate--2,6-diaminopimelate ligase n=1 Tax=Chlorobaculum tepidum (strain ATCC 49652 / DSM 12025 / NBRC 103806 / TLS) TaxID=194439 RepID=MURE_CHLTE|nr:UDP-N-acetylmuramoyl-L-alanyl-D-glutamate--2,6-diaminopimelate ligase [Chlorobaculum tepidum]Q8KGC9.1 RecName: Full=UDP-N-acetylmuramoyl-L-alanyl-D-glutamate--2,6-diaminopimelate ligase; AltName: Full=Meso-A2pm-adding enzyme; AltName: Full=Meso-diaminopimelate-adding enzyme; AltName: Full=UDP-MurNAc-L-Ala-D-Glu:meso-diaminopimelate ligase; AltName: Full=UDP-MurNAc-tripeptide synthetase; AltName: Full=UDP-N-acetylmuramyl-tripeptide synthetase [Chlorobaculum tepidum TLS]AAM71287.1 UDP-N-acetylmu